MKKFLMKGLSSLMIFSAMIAVTIAFTFTCVSAYENQTHMGIITLILSAVYSWIIFRVDTKLNDKIRKEEQE